MIAALIVIVVAVVAFSMNSGKNGEIVSFSYYEGLSGFDRYTLAVENGVITASYSYQHESKEGSITEVWSQEKLKDFRKALLNKLKVTKWKSKYEPTWQSASAQVSWDVFIKFEDGKEFRSVGRQTRPPRFNQFWSLLQEYFPSP